MALTEVFVLLSWHTFQEICPLELGKSLPSGVLKNCLQGGD